MHSINLISFSSLLVLTILRSTSSYWVAGTRFHRPLISGTCFPLKAKNQRTSESADVNTVAAKEKTVLEQVASKGLAGVLAIFVAEAIFWAAGLPLAEIWFKFTTGEWIDLSTPEGQLKATAFSFGYGGFATVILQYRVTLFAIPLVPIIEKYVLSPRSEAKDTSDQTHSK